MALLAILKSDILTARKNRDSLRLSYLSTLFSAAERVGKDDGNRESTDAEVLKTISKFLDGINETLPLSTGTRAEELRQEQTQLQAYLDTYAPKKADASVVQTAIAEIVEGLAAGEKNPKSMGAVMKSLKARFGDSLDAAVASNLVRAALSA